MNTISRFVRELKSHLQKKDGESYHAFVSVDIQEYGTLTGTSVDVTVDWDVLNAEIDAFCAEFAKGKP